MRSSTQTATLPTDVAIRAEGLSKRYTLGPSTAGSTLRDELSARIGALFGGRRQQAPAGGEFWALTNVSFDVHVGEILGLIGHNGAGKTTLLRILSRITDPTAGRAVTRGRVGSLLEVGTGFHPELSGRENIFLNGAILGMSSAEINRKFDQIVDFSGVGRFLDTPVKRYSSGMHVRLAFAVAAHLQPDILIVDEVLAVGDAAFQQRCLGKMGEVARSGRTVLLVSHNMNAVLNLCHRAIVLEHGEVAFAGRPAEAVRNYLESTTAAGAGFADVTKHPGRPPHMTSIVNSVGLRTLPTGPFVSRVNTGDDLLIDIDYECGDRTVDVVQVGISSLSGYRLLTVGTHLSSSSVNGISGSGTIRCRLPHVPLTAGEYHVTVMMTRRLPWQDLDYVEAALRFHVDVNDYFGTGLAPLPAQGPMAQRSEWNLTHAGFEPKDARATAAVGALR